MINFDVVNDIATTNKTVFLLADLDVPLDNAGNIINDEKIKKAMPTINYLVKTGARVVIATHLGYPVDSTDNRFSTKPIAKYLDKRMHCNVNFTNDCIGEQSKRDIFRTEYGDIIVLENLLFHKEEKECDVNFARKIADGMNVYVNDSFVDCNHAYSSVVALPLFVRPVAGLVLTDIIKKLDFFLNCHKKTSTAIIGGSDLEIKMNIIENLCEKIRYIFLCGDIANVFLSYNGYNVGTFTYDEKYKHSVEKIIKKIKHSGCMIVYPEEVKVIKKIGDNMINKNVSEIANDDNIIDIGNKTLDTLTTFIDMSDQLLLLGTIETSFHKNYNLSSNIISKSLAQILEKKRAILYSTTNNQCLKHNILMKHYQDKIFLFNNDSLTTYLSGLQLFGLSVLRSLSSYNK